MQKRYEERIRRQSERIGLYIEFLTERELVREFNDWEAAKREAAKVVGDTSAGATPGDSAPHPSS